MRCADEVTERLEARRREVEAAERGGGRGRGRGRRRRGGGAPGRSRSRALREAQGAGAGRRSRQAGGHAVELAAAGSSQVAVNVRAMQGLKGELDRGVAFEAYALRASQAPPAGQHRCFQGIPSPSHAAARAAPPSLGKVSICPAK